MMRTCCGTYDTKMPIRISLDLVRMGMLHIVVYQNSQAGDKIRIVNMRQSFAML